MLTAGAPLLVLLLPLAAGLTVVACGLAGDDLRSAVLRGFVLFGTLVALSTETLSVFARLDRLTLAVFWLTACACAGLLIAFLRRRHFKSITSGQGSKRESDILAQLNLVEKLCVLGIVATLTPVALTAIFGAPNVVDAMAYHMPRVVFWSQARSIAIFPTSFQQQILLQPFNEYLQLHTYVLAGGDRFVCVVQWFAFAGCVLGGSLIAGRLGASREGQLLTALAGATIPMGILQASGAKNDLTLTFLLVAAAYFGVVWMQRGRMLDLWTLSGAFALALFTKGTAYVIAPGLLAGAIIAARPLRWRRLAAAVLPMIAATLVINGPQYIRCYRHGVSPVGPATAYADGYGRFANDKLGIPVVLSNVVRNVGLHFIGLPGTTRFVYAIHRVLGIDPADPATTWPGTRFEAIQPADCERNEACAPSTIHVILLLLAIPVVCWMWIRGVERRLFFYCGGVILSFVLFCALIRWQPWHSRLHLGFLIPGAVIIGVLLSRIPSASVKIMLCAILLIQAQLFVCRSHQHPLISRESVLIKSREHQYFYDSPGIESAYSNAADYVRRSRCSMVGIDNSFQGNGQPYRLAPVEYQMLALLKERIPGVRFIHVGVHDRSAQYTNNLPFAVPCAVVCLSCASDPQKSTQYRSATEPAVFAPVVVFSRMR